MRLLLEFLAAALGSGIGAFVGLRFALRQVIPATPTASTPGGAADLVIAPPFRVVGLGGVARYEGHDFGSAKKAFFKSTGRTEWWQGETQLRVHE